VNENGRIRQVLSIDTIFELLSRCEITFASVDGRFLEHLPPGTESYEIKGGIDLFNWTKTDYDWIVTNHPFKDLTKWLKKAFDVASNVVFLIPLSKLYSSLPRMDAVFAYGGIEEILYLGSGRAIGFDIGFPFAAIHFCKDYHGCPIHVKRRTN